MYNQSAQWVSRRRRARPRRPAERGRGAAPRSRERVRLIQLGVCLALFLVVFVGRGASPSGRMAQLQQRLQTVLTADTDFRAAFSALGESLSGQGPILGELGEFCIQVFGAGGGLPEGAEDYAAGAAFQTEQDFLNRPAGAAERAAHYLRLEQAGQQDGGEAAGGFTPHEDVEETGSPEAWNTRFREKSGTKMRNCPSGPWRPWDSWIWSERAAPLAFGRVSAPPPCGVQASGGARPLGRGVSPPRRRVSFPAMGKKPKDRRGRGRWTTAPLCSA